MNESKIKTNFYEAVNDEWLKNAKIPDDQPSMSAFLELNLAIEKTLMDLTEKWAKDPSTLSPELKEYIKLYSMTNDFQTREKLGAKPFNVILEPLNGLNSLSDLENSFKNFTLQSMETPFNFSVMQDFKNSNNQVLYFSAARLILPDTSYYKDEEKKQQLLSLFKQTTSHLLTLYGFSEDKIESLINDTIEFDALLVPLTKSSVEKADYVKMYNPVSKEDIKKYSKHFDLIKSAEALVNEPVDKLIVTNLDFIHNFDAVINESHFDKLKSWMIVSNAIKFASELTDEMRVASGAFSRALSGIKEAKSQEKFAFYQAYNRFDQIVGIYYGETYFGPKAKEDVKTMVYEMIDVYKSRISENTWLNQDTIQKALKKLSTLEVHVGYPEEVAPYYEKFSIDGYEQGSDLIKERLKMNKQINEYRFNQFNQPPNRNLWSIPASMVNAYYSPFNNQIVFPAAILQEPYYSLNQSPSENFGGIGAVIAHEISHAFDNNGAKFDETGSLNNWWSESDLKAFKQKSKDMIELFDGVETGYGPCNGELTVSENIADSGGLRCALEASKKHNDHNLDDFFKNWARVWRNKSSKEFNQLLLKVDVHGPAILRANMQLRNMEEFQDYYNIKESDPMFLSKDEMVSIW